MADKNTKPAGDDTATAKATGATQDPPKENVESSTGAPDAQAAEIARLKEELAASNKRADDEAAKRTAAEEQAKAANDEAARAQTSGQSEVADLRALVEKLAAKVDAGEARTAQSDADDKADRDAAFAPRVVPGETDEFGRPWNPPAPFKNPRAYRATEKVYVDGVLYDAGDTVVTNQRPSRTLVPISEAEAVAMNAGNEDTTPRDVNLADMSATELRAFLASKGIDHGGLQGRDALLTAALAWRDPTR